MSTLTKIFLVLVAVFSVALSTLTIAANSMQSSWKKSAEDWKAAALAAQANERVVAVQSKLTHDQSLDSIRKLSGEVERLNNELLKHKQNLDARSVELAQSQNQSSSLTANVTGLRETLEVVNGQFAREQEFNRKIGSRNAELERRNIDLNDRVKELTSSLAMANAQVRALQQQVGGYESERPSGLGMKPATATEAVVEANLPSVQVAYPSTTAPIRGQVTEVRGNVASINVGSADGVQPGMSFMIFRPGGSDGRPQYLGTLQVAKLESRQSAGLLIRTTGDIRPGDRASDESSVAMRP